MGSASGSVMSIIKTPLGVVILFVIMLVLAGVTAFLFRPYAFMDMLHFGSKYTWYVIGVALFGFVYLIQWPRARAAARQAA